MLFWIDEGVRLFRVDNPHTKPLPFWEWLIAEVRARYPDVVFLAEAFTRPKVMYRLAKLGFSQSYTYFTWRNTKARADRIPDRADDQPRANSSGRISSSTRPTSIPASCRPPAAPGFLIRAALAATLSGLWGVYSGFELCEARALPGREEYLDSEKYEIRAWDWNAPGNIIAEITALNRIRRENPALQSHLGIASTTPSTTRSCSYAKATADLQNVVLVAVSLDPHFPQEATSRCRCGSWGLSDYGALRGRRPDARARLHLERENISTSGSIRRSALRDLAHPTRARSDRMATEDATCRAR